MRDDLFGAADALRRIEFRTAFHGWKLDAINLRGVEDAIAFEKVALAFLFFAVAIFGESLEVAKLHDDRAVFAKA